MDIGQYFTATDLFGIIPEIILTVTALSVLTLEMVHIFHSRIILIVASLGLLYKKKNGVFSLVWLLFLAIKRETSKKNYGVKNDVI